MLVEKVRELYDKKYDYNCSECILRATNEVYDLNLSNQTVKAMAGFGGGMAIGSICGGATGAIAAIGIMYTKDRAHNNPEVKMMTSEFMENFNAKLGSLECYDLIKKYRSEEDRCIKILEAAAETLEEIVNKYKDVYKIIR